MTTVDRMWGTRNVRRTKASLAIFDHSFVFLPPQHNVMLRRRREGVTPDMPAATERQEILSALGGKPY